MKMYRIVCILCALLASPYALAQSKYSYLHETTTEILKTDRGALKLSVDDVGSIATRACKTLMILLKDRNFHKDLEALQSASATTSAYHQQLSDDIILFVDSFLQSESGFLTQAGIKDKAVANKVLLIASSLRASLRERPDQKRILQNVEKLRAEICYTAENIAKLQENVKTQEQRTKMVRRWGLGFVGLTLIAADTIALVPSSGAAIASYTLGGAAVGAAIAQ